MFEFPWSEFQNERVVVTVNTQNEYRSFLKKCVDKNINWVDGVKIDPDFDCTYYDKTFENCFVCHIGLMTGNVKEILDQLPTATTQIIAYSLFNF